jgi:hypothetical protein
MARSAERSARWSRTVLVGLRMHGNEWPKWGRRNAKAQCAEMADGLMETNRFGLRSAGGSGAVAERSV